jgi:ketosteroid isomerase-like protein
MEDFARGDVASTLAIWDPAIRWNAVGHNPLAGRYYGHDGALEYLAELHRITGGTFDAEIVEVRPMFGETYVARFRVRASAGEHHLDVPLSLILDTRDRRVVSVVEVHHEAAAWDAFWTAAVEAAPEAPTATEAAGGL